MFRDEIMFLIIRSGFFFFGGEILLRRGSCEVCVVISLIMLLLDQDILRRMVLLYLNTRMRVHCLDLNICRKRWRVVVDSCCWAQSDRLFYLESAVQFLALKFYLFLNRLKLLIRPDRTQNLLLILLKLFLLLNLVSKLFIELHQLLVH